VRALEPDLSFLAGTKAATFFLFSHATQPPCRERFSCGEPRSVRSMPTRCRFFPLARVFPTAIQLRTRHLRRLSPPQRSDDRRARVSGPSEGRVPCLCARGFYPSRRVPALGGDELTTFPSSASREHPLSPVRLPPRRRPRRARTDRPRSSFQRHPAKGSVFPETRCFPPPRFTGARKDRSFRLPASASRSRRPHVFPSLGKGASRALQALQMGRAHREHRESRRLYNLLD